MAELLDAMGLLVKSGHDVSLDIAGQMEGWAPQSLHEYRERLRRRAGEPDLTGRVRFLGWREDIDTVLHEASIHCCPSQPEQREGFGTTVIEAKRAGIPSVVCPSGGLSELITHRDDGWVAHGFDAAAIAEGLEWFLSDARRLATAQQRALESSRRFDPAIFEQRWQEQFDMRSRPAGRADSGACLADVPGASG